MTSNRKPEKSGHTRAQQGVTLIETLIAGVILAIGVLGIISLLALSKVSQHEGIQRVRAVALGNDLLERIRRNPGGAAIYHTGFGSAALGNNSITTEPDACTTGATCTAAQMAARDLWVWEQRLDGELVTVVQDGETRNTASLRGLRGCIDFEADTDRTNTGIVSVVLQWQSMKESTDAVASGEDVCGDDAGGAGTETTRRQVVVSSYVVDEMEL